MTRKKNLEDLLHEVSQQEKERKIDWRPKLEAWKTHVDSLYSTIEGWLKPASDKHYLNVTRQIMTLNEEYAGSYQIQKLILLIGTKKIDVLPIGMNVIGARGRVDVVGPKGQNVMLLLLGENEKPQITLSVKIAGAEEITDPKIEAKAQEPLKLVWKIGQRQPNLTVFPLTEEIFTEVIDQLLS